MIRRTLLAAALISLPAAAQGPFGLGLFLGEPLGITAKYNLDPKNAIDGMAAWSFGRGSSFYLHADYIHHLRGLVKVDQESFDLHFGFGGALAIGDGTAFALRLPVGLGYTFDQVPIEVFVEIGLNFFIAPSVAAGVTGGIGGRYYF